MSVRAIAFVCNFLYSFEVYTFKLSQFSGSEKYIFLVSNKNDLTDDARTVSHEEALGAAMLRNCHFIETSAASNTGVNTLFVGILNKMMDVTALPSIPHWRSKWLFRGFSFGKSDKTHFKATYKT